MSKFFILLCLCLSLYSMSCTAEVPGGIVIIDLEQISSEPPAVYFQGHRTLVVANPDEPKRWRSIIGIPLTSKAGTHQIKISSQGQEYKQNFTIRAKSYPQEKLTIKNKRKVQPLPEDKILIERQYLETIAVYNSWKDQAVDNVQLKIPVAGRKSSPFGLQRIMNNIPQNPHSGLDIAAPKGTPVHAAKAGKVVKLGDFFYSGKIVFLDHGQGFITSYCHLDSITVQENEYIQQGDMLGTVGNTGRATGPHLHWSVSLNGVRVDPQYFIYE